MLDRWVCLDVGETLIDETRLWSLWADELGVPRATLFAALTPEQRMDAPVTVGRLTGDQRLDLGDKRCLGLWSTAPALSGPLRCCLHGQIGARHPERIGYRLHGVPSRAGEGDRNSRFFG